METLIGFFSSNPEAYTRWITPLLVSSDLEATVGSRGKLLSGVPEESAIDEERYIDISADGAGVRADLMGLSYEAGCLLRIADGWQRYVELDAKLESSIVNRYQRHRGINYGIVGSDVHALPEDAEHAFETSRVANREQLLRIRCPARTTELLR